MTQQEITAQKELEENFWKQFNEIPWPWKKIGQRDNLGKGLYNQLKKDKSSMHTLSLRYFSVILKPEDIHGSMMMSTIFNGAVRHCRKKGYGDSFSMDDIFGFKIDNKGVFHVIKITVNGQNRFGKNPGENELRKTIRDGNIVEVFFIEDIN